MNFIKIINAYENKDVDTLKMYINTYECKILPLVGANGAFDENEDLFIDICYWMYENGLDVNMVEDHGNCGLIVAALNNKEKYIKMFLDCGADVNKKGQKGISPLFVALEYKASLNIIKMLISAGADLNHSFTADGYKWSILAETCCYGDFDLLEYMLEHGSLIAKQKESIDALEWDDTELDKKIQATLKKYEELQNSSEYKPKKIESYKRESKRDGVDFDYDGTLQLVKDTCKKIMVEAKYFRVTLDEKLDSVRYDEDNYDINNIINAITDAAVEQGDRFVNFIELIDKSTRVPFERLNDFNKIKDIYQSISKSIKAFDSINIDWGLKKYNKKYIYPIPASIKEIEEYWKKLYESMPEYDKKKNVNNLSELLLYCIKELDKMSTITDMCEYDFSLNEYSLSTMYDELNKLCKKGIIKKDVINKKSYFGLSNDGK